MRNRILDVSIACMIAAMVIMLISLQGCSVLTGTGDYEHYTNALSSHSESENTRITNQAVAISDMATASIQRSATPTEAALQSALATMIIGQLRPFPLDIKKPTTGMDVANAAVGQIPFIASTYGMFRLGQAGIEAAGTTTIGANSTVADSFIRNENHATGYQSTSTLAPKEAAAPVIVEPSYPPVTP